jgi:hypothetical protein
MVNFPVFLIRADQTRKAWNALFQRAVKQVPNVLQKATPKASPAIRHGEQRFG